MSICARERGSYRLHAHQYLRLCAVLNFWRPVF